MSKDIKVIGNSDFEKEIFVKCGCHTHLLSISVDDFVAYIMHYNVSPNIEDKKELCWDIVLEKDKFEELGHAILDMAKQLKKLKKHNNMLSFEYE